MEAHDTFKCAMCGQCCANQDVIQLTSFELYRLAGYLMVGPVELFKRCCTITETNQNVRRHMYILTTEGRCPFLEGRLCSVHPARPSACRAYPMRAPESEAGDMKRFVRQKYPELERTCSLFLLDDHDTLSGDMGLLVDQTIAYAIDEIYFNMIATEAVDLTVPARVTADFLGDAVTRDEALAFLQSAGQRPMVKAIGRMAMALQAASWGAAITFVREPSKITLEHAVEPGNYVLAATDRASVDAVKALIRSPGLYCKAFSIVTAPGRMLISAAYGAPDGSAAIGFQLELEDASIREMSWNGATPLYVFFVPEGEEAGQAVGLTLNVDQL